MSAYLTPSFWLDALERSLKTFAQTAIATLGGDAVFNVFKTDVATWVAVAGFAGGAALVSVLTSVASAQIGSDDSASLVE